MKNSQTLLKVAFILVLILGMHQALSAQVTEQDSLALVALYNSTDGPNWTHNDNWLSGPVSTWYGVTVSGDRVTGLDLTDNNLSGTIPPEISALTRLDFLILYENHLTGSIPPEIGNLTHLEILGLIDNQFDGSIPVEIGNLTNLAALYLDQNQLSGTLPAEIGNLTQLNRLSLAANQLTGEIPPEIGNLTNLHLLFLSDNQLSGRIPTEMGRLTKLKTLSLYNNALSDTVKVNFANLKNLKELHLNGNEFVGSLPAGLDSLPALQNLLLSNNRFTDLQNLSPDTSLTRLHIGNNLFTFEDIEPNVWVETFNYSPQDSVGEARDTTLEQGASFEMSVSVGGTANQYQWMKDGDDIPGANGSTYTIASAGENDIGDYVCKITNTLATQLTLYSRPIRVTVSGATGVSGRNTATPKEFALHQNYPNPFNPTTSIAFSVAKATHVELTVFDRLGREVATLVNRKYRPGQYNIKFDAGQLASGLYFYRMRMGDFLRTRKMLLVR